MKKVLMLSAVLGMFFSVLHAQKVDYGLKTGDQVTIDGMSYTALRNLISNGGFDDSSLTGWARGNNYNSTARVNYYIYWYDYDGVNNSPYIYQSSCSPTSSYAIAKHWALDTGKKYYLSFWTRGIYEESYSPVFSLTNLESTGASQNEYGDGCQTILGRSSSDQSENTYEYMNVSEDGSTWVRTSLVFDSGDYTWLQFRLSDNSSDIQFDEFFLCELKKSSDVTMRDTLSIPKILNPSFDNNSNYWSFNWYRGYSYGTTNYENNNFIYWYNSSSSIGNSFDIYQDLTDVPNGLYLLQAQAVQRNANTDQVGTNINEEASTQIYINGYAQAVKGIYEDAQEENIYGDYYTQTPEGKYIPNSNNWTPIAVAFNNGLYDNTVFGRVTNNSLRVGIRNNNQQWNYSRVAADNFRLSFIDDADLKYYRDSIATWATQLEVTAMSSEMKTELQSKIAILNSATTYEDMADAFIDVAAYGKVALVNIKSYSELALSAEALKNRLAEGANMNSTSVAEGDSLMNVFKTAYEGGILSTEEARTLKTVIDEQMVRLNYLHLDIAVTTPGSMGDSILAKVENFADVQSLRLSGKLNEDDIATLKNRLTSLVEIDLSKLDWTAIPSEQFREKSGLRRVILPDNLTSIGSYGFYSCLNLTNVTLPTGLRTIGSYAFYGCQNITNITLPTGLRTIGSHAFYNCRALASVNFPEGLTSIGSYAFYSNTSGYYDEQGYYHEKGGALKEVSLPSTLQTLGEYSFAYQTSLEKVAIADGLASIERYAFNNCTSLTELKLPLTLQTINTYAFNNCSSLRNLELPEGLITLNEGAFRYCSALEEVILPSSLLNVYYYPFTSCQNLTKMTSKAIVPPYANSNIMGGSEPQCTLTVPSLSVNVYKQSSYWDKFNIVGEQMMPDNITITSDYKLNWPDSLNIEYKPNVYITSDDNQSRYGSLTVNGNSTLSASQFTMKYDPNICRNNTQYNSQTRSNEYTRTAYTSLVNNANVRADNVTLEVWTRANVWDFIAVPFDIKVSDIGLAYEETPFVIRKYDGEKRAAGLTSETWVNMTADSTLHAGQGYIWRSASTDANRNYNGFYLNALQTVNKNNMFVNKDLEIELAYHESEFEHNRSWNFIGNPYPCYYDTRAMQTSAPITIWNGYNSVYEAYSPADDSYILNPGQAFFVQRPVDEDKITFLKEGRQTNLTVRDVEYGANRAASMAERSVFNLVLSGEESMGDHTRFVINSSAKMDYESGRDASKFMSLDSKAAQLYSIQNGVRYAINERPLNDGIIELGLQFGAEGTFTLTLSTTVDNEVYLVDRLTGTEVRLDGTDGYTFHADKGTVEGRFAIRLGNGDTTGISDVKIQNNAEGESWYDLQGRRTHQPQKGVFINKGKKVVVK